MNGFLAVIFPSKPDIEALENLTPGDFFAKARKPIDNDTCGTISLFCYKDPLVRQTLWALKYGGNKKIAGLFAKLLYDRIIEEISDEIMYSPSAKILIVPMPMSKERRTERGWNQSEMIARCIAKYDRTLEFETDILEKIRHTAPQTKLSRRERLKNLRGCFRVSDPEKINGRIVILIDDVTTTGSTMKEANLVIAAAKPRRIICLAVAH